MCNDCSRDCADGLGNRDKSINAGFDDGGIALDFDLWLRNNDWLFVRRVHAIWCVGCSFAQR
jgi:hypothetical protein